MGLKKPIVLVEDTEDDIELLRRSFKQLHIDHPLVVLTNGAEAVDYFLRQGKYATEPLSPTPILVLLDLKLPKLSGLDVLKRLRENDATKLLPVVVLTTSVEMRDKIQCYTLHANSYIQKPVNFDQFIETARQIGTYWLTLNQAID